MGPRTTALDRGPALWKDADPDIPILKQAKAEYAKLQLRRTNSRSPIPSVTRKSNMLNGSPVELVRQAHLSGIGITRLA